MCSTKYVRDLEDRIYPIGLVRVWDLRFQQSTASFCLLIYLWIILIFIVMAFGSLLNALASRLLGGLFIRSAFGFLFIIDVCYFN